MEIPIASTWEVKSLEKEEVEVFARVTEQYLFSGRHFHAVFYHEQFFSSPACLLKSYLHNNTLVRCHVAFPELPKPHKLYFNSYSSSAKALLLGIPTPNFLRNN